jgi:hypothetical protein
VALIIAAFSAPGVVLGGTSTTTIIVESTITLRSPEPEPAPEPEPEPRVSSLAVVCTPPLCGCVDHHLSCSRRALEGECASNAQWMASNCVRSCDQRCDSTSSRSGGGNERGTTASSESQIIDMLLLVLGGASGAALVAGFAMYWRRRRCVGVRHRASRYQHRKTTVASQRAIRPWPEAVSADRPRKSAVKTRHTKETGRKLDT